MDISHQHTEQSGTFFAKEAQETPGEMTYSIESPGIMSIEHTEVKTSERGNNVGMQLLDAAVAYARESQLQIKPVCKFVQVMFRKHADKYDDVNSEL